MIYSNVFCSSISCGCMIILKWCVVLNSCSSMLLKEILVSGFWNIGLYIVWIVILNLLILVFCGI